MRSKEGCPSGTMFSNRKEERHKYHCTRERKYSLILHAAKRGRQEENGALQKIVLLLKKKQKLDNIDILVKTICSTNQHGGHTSPLLKIEDIVVASILQMACITRQYLSLSEGVSLMNSLIDKQLIQQEFINWKTKYSNNFDGCV